MAEVLPQQRDVNRNLETSKCMKQLLGNMIS